jgi:PAS domain S-box-containing protein
MKTVIIGAGRGCRAVLELVTGQRLTTLSLEIAGVVDQSVEAPGMVFAREQGWPTFTDMYTALRLPGLELVIELTGRDEVRDQIFQRLSPHVRFMDHHMARVFWDLDEVNQHLLDELEQRIQLEMDIREDQTRLQEILDSLPDSVMVLDEDARIERVNRRYEAETGLRFQEVAGRRCYELAGATEDACQDAQCPRQQVLLSGKPITVVQQHSCLSVECPTRDCYYEITANRIHDRRGKTSVVVTSREVTEQVMLKRETEESARRFTQIVDTVHGLITIRDLQGTHQLANPAACRFFGLPAEAFLGRTHHELWPPEVADLFQANDEEALAHPGEHVTHEEVFVLRDREYILITERILLTDYKQDPVALCSVSRNVTESRRLQQELVLTEKHAAVGKLAAGVAHELNNPLTGILTFTEDLLDDAEEGTPLHEDLEVIMRETLRCRRIVRDLLDFSRRDRLRRHPLNLESVVDRTLGMVAKQAAFHDIEFEVDTSDVPTLTQGDPTQLQQVLLNLVINARDAMDGRGRITIRTEHDSGRVALSVTDEGVGIPEENYDRIFEPFFSTKGNQGNGLGLAAVRSIIERHGGEIQVTSALQRGATFRVILPAAVEEAAPLPAPAEATEHG